MPPALLFECVRADLGEDGLASSSSIASIREDRDSPATTMKVPLIAVRLQKIHRSESAATALFQVPRLFKAPALLHLSACLPLLQDHTGIMEGYIHREVLEDFTDVSAGCILLLRKVTVYTPPGSDKDYLNVTPNNVLKVYPASVVSVPLHDTQHSSSSQDVTSLTGHSQVPSSQWQGFGQPGRPGQEFSQIGDYSQHDCSRHRQDFSQPPQSDMQPAQSEMQAFAGLEAEAEAQPSTHPVAWNESGSNMPPPPPAVAASVGMGLSLTQGLEDELEEEEDW